MKNLENRILRFILAPPVNWAVDPVNCLAFEDSFNGAISAKAARMKLVTVPDSHDFPSTRFDFADLKIASLTDFKEKDFEHLNSLN